MASQLRLQYYIFTIISCRRSCGGRAADYEQGWSEDHLLCRRRCCTGKPPPASAGDPCAGPKDVRKFPTSPRREGHARSRVKGKPPPLLIYNIVILGEAPF